MLNLGSSVSTKSRQHFNPLRFKECIAWYDFADTTHMYSDAGVTTLGPPATANGDEIYRVDNKAYALAPNDNKQNAIGAYIETTGALEKPAYRNTTGVGHAQFVSRSHLKCSYNSGNAKSGAISDSTVTYKDMTVYVIASTDQTDFSTPDYIFRLFGPGNADWCQMIVSGNVGHYKMDTNQTSPKTGGGADSGVDVTSGKQLLVWNSSGTTSGNFYVNGRTGVGISNGACVDLAADLDDAACYFSVGDWNANNSGFVGHIGEIIIYNTSLSRDDSYEIEKYLMSKHEISINNSKV